MSQNMVCEDGTSANKAKQETGTKEGIGESTTSHARIIGDMATKRSPHENKVTTEGSNETRVGQQRTCEHMGSEQMASVKKGHSEQGFTEVC